ncbi:MAG: hypothetical protein GY850_40920 [bacterium]|nr:hypothetical protein [bacterium]
MAVEKEIDLYNSDDFEFDFVEESDDTIKNVLDERDYIPPLKEIEEEISGPWEIDDFMDTKKQDEDGIGMQPVAKDEQEVNSGFDEETEILLHENDEQLSDTSASADAKLAIPYEMIDPQEDHPDTNWSEDEEVAPPAENHFATNEVGNEADAEEKIPAPEVPFGKPSSLNKIICVILIGMVIAGFVLYFSPNLIELTKAEKVEAPAPDKGVQPEIPVPQPATVSAQSGKRDLFMAKLADAAQLRNELLEKRDEIYELNLHYHDGIAELENEIQQEIKKESINSYKKAIKNTRIRLNLRTIQRRLAYIEELTKPAYWLNSGSEELYYLVRKAEVDLQLIGIAGGIDLNKHMRHISAAIQRYRPGPDKLAVDPLLAKPQSLEQIWQQVSTEKQKRIKRSLNPKDKIITNQICGGNFSRIAELTSISPRAAQCLSRMKGSDLFLNELKTLTPDAAKRLFQWQGNWVCLNGVSQLSEPVAQHLFKWKGNWISLNSLNEFPPELAKHLLKWEGQQLELMGLEFKKSKANKKTMRYLALWETTGGKLYVSDRIRRGMDDLM